MTSVSVTDTVEMYTVVNGSMLLLSLRMLSPQSFFMVVGFGGGI
jgi:hypothetical protein